MSLQFTGKLRQVFDYKTGTSERGKWENVKACIEEPPKGTYYPSGIVVEVWKPELIRWMKSNIGATVTVLFEPRVEEYNNRIYQRNRCFSCVQNGYVVGSNQKEVPPENNGWEQYASDVPADFCSDT